MHWQGEELEPARKKAEAAGVKEIFIDDVREEFVRDYVFPMFRCAQHAFSRRPFACVFCFHFTQMTFSYTGVDKPAVRELTAATPSRWHKNSSCDAVQEVGEFCLSAQVHASRGVT